MQKKIYVFFQLFLSWNLLFFSCLATSALTHPISDQPDDQTEHCVAAFMWGPNEPPTGRNAPYVSSHEEYHVLKLNKYMEGYVDLGQGHADCLRMTGPMTLTVVFQLAKQWPMKCALISKWGFMPGQASYELGITADKNVYFVISEDGRYDGNSVEIKTEKAISDEIPLVVQAVFNPGKKMAVYINGQVWQQQTKDIPNSCFDGHSVVKIGPRFEGLIGGVWFHNAALGKNEIAKWFEKVNEIIPPGTTYDQWKRLKRNVPKNQPDFLGSTAGMKLVKEIDITPYAGSYVCPGDLNNDGRLDFLLYKNGNTYNVPGRLSAIDNDGELLWEKGDLSLKTHEKCGSADIGQKGTTPALRGIAIVYDIDQDGASDVITELWEHNEPMLYILDGQTGQVKHGIKSPISMAIRQPAYKTKRQPSRSHPVIRIARLDGQDQPPSIVLKYGASNSIRCHAFALDQSLHIRWHIEGTTHSMGHIPTVADVDDDGKDEVVLGHMLADDDGSVIWDKGLEFDWHADVTAAVDLLPNPGKEVLISVCGIGPLHCLSMAGESIWSRPREQVEHGQAVWVADFIADHPGKEAIALVSGHIGSFYTFDAATGKTLASFEHRKLLPAYPDFPTIVNWKKNGEQSLWIPQDRILVDGYGRIVAELGSMDEVVAQKLHCGTSWRPVGAQAFALDVCDDQREEVILYEPYEGQAIFIFCNPDSQGTFKPYTAQKNAYNIRSYF